MFYKDAFECSVNFVHCVHSPSVAFALLSLADRVMLWHAVTKIHICTKLP